MAKNSFSWDDLGALNLETGKIEEDKRKELAQKRDRDNNEKIKKEKERFAQKDWTGKPGGNNNNRGFAGKANNKYVGAPYNFVPVWDKVAKLDREKSISHSSAESELISGEINYRITARTPIIISNGNKKPEELIRNHYGKYSIPGSSMSGLIRSNVQILSQSSLADDIDDYVLMFREVGQSKGTGMNRDYYDTTLGSAPISVNKKQISVLKNVKAGYIENTGEGYRIHHTKPDKINQELGEMNYYVLSERFIFEQLGKEKNGFSYLKTIELQHSFNGYEFVKYVDENRHTHYICVESNEKTKEKLSMLEEAITEFREIRKTNNKEEFKAAEGKLKRAKSDCKEILNKNFKPGYFRISYNVSNDRISAIGKEGEYDRNGFLMITGVMNEKKALYVIPQMDREGEYIDIPDNDIKAFQIDYEGKKNQLKEPKSFWSLPEKGEIKPVFYINLERLYFGFTPHLRLFYKYSVHQGLGSEHKAGVFDYSKSLFGFSNENDSYRSRISFSDAEVEGSVQPMQEQIITLGNPKPSSYADYLKTKPDGRSFTYNDSDFRIRGIKQYWLREETKNKKIVEYKENVDTKFKPLPKGTTFYGQCVLTINQN